MGESRGRKMASLIIVAGLAVHALGAQAAVAGPVNPAWIKVDADSKTVEFMATAGMNSTNGGMNFNGTTAGALRLSVPVGWTVMIHFKNSDQGFPHSLEVIGATMPLPTGSVPPAFAHAATGQMVQGMAAGGHQDVRFVADKAGEYVIYCPVPTHGLLGMWMRMEVSASLTVPTLTAVKPGAK